MPPQTSDLTQKHPMDDSDAPPTNKRFKKISVMVEDMRESIQAMRQTVEEMYSYKIITSNYTLEKWRYACTMGKDPAHVWTESELELLQMRLPVDAYFSDTYNNMYDAFCQKPQDGVKEAERILNSILEMRQIIDEYNAKKSVCRDVFGQWMAACEEVCEDMPISQPNLDARLPNVPRLAAYNRKYQSFAKYVQPNPQSFPSPSEFGKEWSEAQAKGGRIYCLRPPEARALPLCILHHVFCQYLLDVEQPLPRESDTAISAQQIAATLCAIMGMSLPDQDTAARHDKETDRTRGFDASISDFLGKFKPMYNLSPRGEANGGIAEGVLLFNGILITLREIIAEPGASGDAYMQVARCYDLAVKVLQQDPSADVFIRQGAPMFLICVVGPMIGVSGGFYDGKRVIVEPLSDFLYMLEDPLGVRQNKVARVLYALRNGIDKLKTIAQNKQSPPPSPPSTPRIYSTCTSYPQDYSLIDTSLQMHLEVQYMIPDLPRHDSLLFIGTLSGDSFPSPTPVVIKLAGRYGEDVHKLLAEQNLAPKLYAKSQVEGAPTAYIMEYMEPSSWDMLYSFAITSRDLDYKEPVLLSMNKVLKILQENNMVHGDLRSPNIMVQVAATGKLVCVDDEGSQRANIKIIDFDWAGEAGKVHYLPTRNEEIDGITWPGKPGYQIEQDHDEQLFNSWWPSLGKES